LVIIPKLSTYRKLFDLIRNEKKSIAIIAEIIAEYEQQLNSFYSKMLLQM
jgi:cytochrome c peroxidase